MLSPLFESDNPNLGIYSKQDGIHLRAIASASTQEEAQTLIEPMEREIWKIAGHAIWGEDDDTPVSAALDALSERSLTLAIAEGFTGGLLSSTMLESASASGVLAGSVIITGGKGDRAVLGASIASPTSPQPEDASLLAQTAREKLEADVGLAITPLVSEETKKSGPVGDDAHRNRDRRGSLRPLGPLPHPAAAHSRAGGDTRASGTCQVSGNGLWGA